MTDPRLVKCEVCGVPWDEHSKDCPRHEYRPGNATGQSVTNGKVVVS